MEIAETSEQKINELIRQQQSFFRSQQTRDLAFRKKHLKVLRAGIKKFETRLYDALWQDLHKSEQEAFLTEISIVWSEIENHLEHLSEWSAEENVSTSLALWPSSSRMVTEPLGVVLILAPWNYPVQLLLNPLVGAISAGCCAIIKPSPDVPHVATVLQEMIHEIFSPDHIALIQGSRPTNEILFSKKFDLIFFTGSTAVGKVVMKAAAEHLTPVVLELGGKSPCIVTDGISLKLAARRIMWGKCMNAGQTCIAPDYVLVTKGQKAELLKELKNAVSFLFGDDPRQSKHYGRIVTDHAYKRLQSLLKDQHLYAGGATDATERYMAPCILDEVNPEDEVMQGEIFGPILPVLEIENLEAAIDFVNARAKPLALYFFGSDQAATKVLQQTSSGGVCVNDTLLHIANHEMPFGGVGESGLGSYHGKQSFLTFSHRKPVLRSSKRIDLPFKYAPYRFYSWIKRIV